MSGILRIENLLMSYILQIDNSEPARGSCTIRNKNRPSASGKGLFCSAAGLIAARAYINSIAVCRKSCRNKTKHRFANPAPAHRFNPL